MMEQEKGVFRWGGLAGILGSIIFILVFAIVVVFVGDAGGGEVGGAGTPERFPEIRAARTVENGLYLLVLMLWIIHFLALYRALRGTSLASALFGSGLGILGLALLAAGALPHVATIPLSDLYHEPGATPEDQAALALMWQATWGIFDAFLVAGLAMVAVGLTVLGTGILTTPAFGKLVGWLTVVIGALGIAAIVVVLIEPGSVLAVINVLSLILFHLVVGRKVYSLSKARA